MAERQGVEINYCPDCRGVWIERGGLDKIIDRSRAYTPASGRGEREGEDDEHDRYHDSRGHRRKSFFSQFFD
jgi:Zn-finger nucleic acid-binding protein